MSSRYRTQQGTLRLRYALPLMIPSVVLMGLVIFPDWPLYISAAFLAAYAVTQALVHRFVQGDQRQKRREQRDIALAHKLALAVNTGRSHPRAVQRASRITGRDHACALDALVALVDHMRSVRIGGSIHRALARAADDRDTAEP